MKLTIPSPSPSPIKKEVRILEYAEKRKQNDSGWETRLMVFHSSKGRKRKLINFKQDIPMIGSKERSRIRQVDKLMGTPHFDHEMERTKGPDRLTIIDGCSSPGHEMKLLFR